MEENYKLEDVVEVIFQSRNIIAVGLAGIRTDINILLNPELTEKAEDILENKDLLKILIKILDKAFNSYILVENLTDVFIIDSEGTPIYLNGIKKLVNELVILVTDLEYFKELEGVPEAEELKSVLGIQLNLNKLIICYEMLNKKEL